MKRELIRRGCLGGGARLTLHLEPCSEKLWPDALPPRTAEPGSRAGGGRPPRSAALLGGGRHQQWGPLLSLCAPIISQRLRSTAGLPLLRTPTLDSQMGACLCEEQRGLQARELGYRPLRPPPTCQGALSPSAEAPTPHGLRRREQPTTAIRAGSQGTHSESGMKKGPPQPPRRPTNQSFARRLLGHARAPGLWERRVWAQSRQQQSPAVDQSPASLCRGRGHPISWRYRRRRDSAREAPLTSAGGQIWGGQGLPVCAGALGMAGRGRKPQPTLLNHISPSGASGRTLSRRGTCLPPHLAHRSLRASLSPAPTC